MRHLRHRRQVLLFFLAIALPCSVLIVLGLRLISQERELEERRLSEDRRQQATQMGDQLLARLERIKLEETSALAVAPERIRSRQYINKEVALLAQVDGDRLVLPWEVRDPTVDRERASGPTNQKLQEGERLELEKKYSQAIESYRRELAATRDATSGAEVRLALARSLVRAGRFKEAEQQYRQILTLPPQAADEDGVPWAIYAADRLLTAGAEHQALAERLASELKVQRWWSPAATYMIRDVLDKIAGAAPTSPAGALAREVERGVKSYLGSLEQALALQSDFSNLGLLRARTARNPEPLWIVYGMETWLLSLGPAFEGQQPLLIAVCATPALSGDGVPVRLAEDGEAGDFLGENFAGLRVAFLTKEDPAAKARQKLEHSFHFAALLLVLGATGFGAYLLLRDVRREVRLAEARSEFVSSVSHELKTPLTAIRMFAETLRMGRSSDPHARQEYLDTIVNESERLTRLLDNVLDFAKIEQGKKVYYFEPASLDEIVHHTARAIEYPLAQQGFELHLEVAENLPPVAVDRDALEQAILNLLSNAVKYSGKNREIALRLSSRNGHALIQVTDRGIGIAPQEHARIFQKFYRVVSPENRGIPGTGLGLAVVEHIVAGHGGRVDVESAPGRGSTFTICLPVRGTS
jgi:signal transduction histidine kinase